MVKNMPDTLILIALISHVYKHLPSNSDFIITIHLLGHLLRIWLFLPYLAVCKFM